MSATDPVTRRLPGSRDGAAVGTNDNGSRAHGRSRRRRRKPALYATGVLIAAVIVFFALNAVYGWTTGASNAASSQRR
jgi:hypothetical protein